jgi:hypothetical protein
MICCLIERHDFLNFYGRVIFYEFLSIYAILREEFYTVKTELLKRRNPSIILILMVEDELNRLFKLNIKNIP